MRCSWRRRLIRRLRSGCRRYRCRVRRLWCRRKNSFLWRSPVRCLRWRLIRLPCRRLRSLILQALLGSVLVFLRFLLLRSIAIQPQRRRLDLLGGFLLRSRLSRSCGNLLFCLLALCNLLIGTNFFGTSTVAGLPHRRSLCIQRIRPCVRSGGSVLQWRYRGSRSRSVRSSGRRHSTGRDRCRSCSRPDVTARSCLLRTCRQRISRSLSEPHLFPLDLLRFCVRFRRLRARICRCSGRRRNCSWHLSQRRGCRRRGFGCGRILCSPVKPLLLLNGLLFHRRRRVCREHRLHLLCAGTRVHISCHEQ